VRARHHSSTVAILAGAVAGALWGAIPGYLKARFGAHEVVNTIMMNWIAFRLSDWLLTGPMKASGFRPVSPTIQPTAELPRFFADPLRFNWGFVLALVMAGIVFWLLFKTTMGFEIRMVGANPDAAKYAGVNIFRNIILAMVLSGGLAGMAGTSVLGVDHCWSGFSAGYGFDSIATPCLEKAIRLELFFCPCSNSRAVQPACNGGSTDRYHFHHPGMVTARSLHRRSSVGFTDLIRPLTRPCSPRLGIGGVMTHSGLELPNRPLEPG
jgi:ABC-type uncharacterized transport system permease subunit